MPAVRQARVSVSPAPGDGIVIRRAETDDLDALVALEERSFDADRMSRRQYRRHLESDSARVLVASRQQLLGSVVVFFRKDSAQARLYSLAIDAAARGQGIGARLLEAALAAAGRQRCTAMRLEVRTDNAAAIALYERHGFRRIGRYERYYQDGADAWRYERSLDPGTPAGGG